MTRRSGFSGPLLLRQMFNTQPVEKQHSRRSLVYVKYNLEFRLWYISYYAFQHSKSTQILGNFLDTKRDGKVLSSLAQYERLHFRYGCNDGIRGLWRLGLVNNTDNEVISTRNLEWWEIVCTYTICSSTWDLHSPPTTSLSLNSSVHRWK